MNPLIAVIVLNWNQEELTRRCLESLEKIDYNNYFIVLVDNGSRDGSELRLKEKFPDINLIKNPENRGFVEGNNIGIEYALKKNADCLFLLNNDTEVDSGAVRKLVDIIESDLRIGIAGALNHYYDQPDKVCSAGGYFNWWTSRLVGINEDKIIKYGWGILKKIHFVPGGSILIKKEVIEKIGLLDSRFFIYYEEADFCMRARKTGYRIVPVKEAKVLHKVAVSFGHGSPAEYYLYTRNLLLFMKKHCPRISIASFFLFDFIKLSLRVIKLFLLGKRKEASAVTAGFVDFFRGNFAKGRLEEFL